MKLSLISTFDLQLLGFWVVMNVINGITRCVFAPPSLTPKEQTLWQRSTYKSGTC